mgnify:FL=1
MEHKAAVKVYRSLFIAFPSYSHWIDKQDDPIATLDAWCRLLAACQPEDVKLVVDQILDGSLNPRQQYDKMDNLPLVIRSRSMRLKEDRERFDKVNEMASDSNERRKENQHLHSMPTLYAEIRRNNKLVQDGKISAEERDELLLDIRRRAKLKR